MTPAPLPIKVTPDARAHKWARAGRTKTLDAHRIHEIRPAMRGGSLLILRREVGAPLTLNGRSNASALLVTESPRQIGAMLAAAGVAAGGLVQ